LRRQPLCSASPVRLGEMLRSEVAVGLVGTEHVVDRGHQRGRHCDGRRLLAAAAGQAMVERAVVAVRHPDRGPRRLEQDRLEPRGPFADPAGSVLAGTLVQPRTEAHPRPEVP
jgi:hypothetical protein